MFRLCLCRQKYIVGIYWKIGGDDYPYLLTVFEFVNPLYEFVCVCKFLCLYICVFVFTKFIVGIYWKPVRDDYLTVFELVYLCIYFYAFVFTKCIVEPYWKPGR